MTHLTLLGALVVTNAMLWHLTNWHFIIIIITEYFATSLKIIQNDTLEKIKSLL